MFFGRIVCSSNRYEACPRRKSCDHHHLWSVTVVMSFLSKIREVPWENNRLFWSSIKSSFQRIKNRQLWLMSLGDFLVQAIGDEACPKRKSCDRIIIISKVLLLWWDFRPWSEKYHERKLYIVKLHQAFFPTHQESWILEIGVKSYGKILQRCAFWNVSGQSAVPE